MLARHATIFYVNVMKIQTIFSYISLMSEVAFVDHHILVSSTQLLSLPSRVPHTNSYILLIYELSFTNFIVRVL